MTAKSERATEARLLTLTPSKLREYLTCPWRYKLRVVDRLGRYEATPALSFGNSLHAALDALHKSDSASKQPADAEIILREHWVNDGYADIGEARDHFERGVQILHRYMEMGARGESKTLATEVYLSRSVRIGGVSTRLGCKVDRVELNHDGSLEMMDYKTNASGHVPTREWLISDLSTFIYYALARLTYPEHDRVLVSQLNVITMAKVIIEYDVQALAQSKRALVDVVRAMARGDLEPRPSEACAWCPVTEYCSIFAVETDLDTVT